MCLQNCIPLNIVTFARISCHFLQNYITPAQSSTAPKPLRTAQLFDYLRKIFEFHRDQLLPELERCLAQPETVGSVFVSYEESLQVYVAYCKAKAASHTLLQEHKTFFEVGGIVTHTHATPHRCVKYSELSYVCHYALRISYNCTC